MHDQIDLANKALETGGKYHGLTYEDGIKATLEWVMGQTEMKPMDE